MSNASQVPRLEETVYTTRERREYLRSNVETLHTDAWWIVIGLLVFLASVSKRGAAVQTVQSRFRFPARLVGQRYGAGIDRSLESYRHESPRFREINESRPDTSCRASSSLSFLSRCLLLKLQLIYRVMSSVINNSISAFRNKLHKRKKHDLRGMCVRLSTDKEIRKQYFRVDANEINNSSNRCIKVRREEKKEKKKKKKKTTRLSYREQISRD